MKTKIYIKEIYSLMDRVREINSLKIDDVIFYDEFDKPIEIDKKNIEDWKFSGLTIIDFIFSDFYKTINKKI